MAAMDDDSPMDVDKSSGRNGEKMFALKKWNAVAMWSWDVECDTCAICRVQVMGETRDLILAIFCDFVIHLKIEIILCKKNLGAIRKLRRSFPTDRLHSVIMQN